MLPRSDIQNLADTVNALELELDTINTTERNAILKSFDPFLPAEKVITETAELMIQKYRLFKEKSSPTFLNYKSIMKDGNEGKSVVDLALLEKTLTKLTNLKSSFEKTIRFEKEARKIYSTANFSARQPLLFSRDPNIQRDLAQSRTDLINKITSGKEGYNSSQALADLKQNLDKAFKI